jgi:hypothetical protein
MNCIVPKRTPSFTSVVKQHDLFQPGLKDRQFAALEALDLGRVDVDA